MAKDDPVLSSISRNVRDILFGELIFRNGPREILVRHDNDGCHALMTVGRKKLMDRKNNSQVILPETRRKKIHRLAPRALLGMRSWDASTLRRGTEKTSKRRASSGAHGKRRGGYEGAA